jgi:hypothetical protein
MYHGKTNGWRDQELTERPCYQGAGGLTQRGQRSSLDIGS